METLFVILGGAFGSTTRFFLGKRFASMHKHIPIGTFIINVSGAFLLGVITGFDISQLMYGLFAEGFLGAYTTFSTFMYEDFVLIQNNRALSAVIYIVATILTGLIACYCGSLTSSILISAMS